MGLLSKMRNLTGSVPKELLEHGLLGRGIIVSVQQTSVSTGADFDPATLYDWPTQAEALRERAMRYSPSFGQEIGLSKVDRRR